MKIKTLIVNHPEISLSKLSRETGISRQTLYGIIESKSKPTYTTAKALCDYFGADINNFWEDIYGKKNRH